MARTEKKTPYNYYNKEDKAHRKPHQKSYRVKVREAIAAGNYDDIPEFTRTSGWLTH